jgi:hypothetical protein
MKEYPDSAVETIQGEKKMPLSKVADWSYKLGSVAAAVAILYRLLWFGGLGERLFGAPHVLPHNFVELSILLLVLSIASNAHATNSPKK